MLSPFSLSPADVSRRVRRRVRYGYGTKSAAARAEGGKEAGVVPADVPPNGATAPPTSRAQARHATPRVKRQLDFVGVTEGVAATEGAAGGATVPTSPAAPRTVLSSLLRCLPSTTPRHGHMS